MAQRDKLENIHAPQLAGEPGDWINTNGKALRIEKGTPYLIDFWDYTCVNCIRTLPYITDWHSRYSPFGLVIIGIHTPEFQFAGSRNNVEQAVHRFGIEYPVLLDNSYRNWQSFANRYWPMKYLIDPEGYIVYQRAGEGAYVQTECMIQQVIRSAHPDADLPDIGEVVTGFEEPGAVCYPMSPELYAGYARGELGNQVGYQPDKVVNFIDRAVHEDGFIYARGPWFNGREFMRHARKTDHPEDYLVIRYHALEVNAVVRSASGKPLDVVVTQDDQPIKQEDKGDDIFYRNGRSFFNVSEPRMYNIVKNRTFGSYELKLYSVSDSFELYAFTFGSCEESKQH